MLKLTRLLAALAFALLIVPAAADDVSNGSYSPTDGSNTSAPPNGWPAGMQPNQVEPVGRAMMGATKRWWERANAAIATTGVAPHYVYTPTNFIYPTGYTNGEVVCFRPNFSSAGSDDLNVNGLGAKPLYLPAAGGAIVVTAAAIQNAEPVCAVYLTALNAGGGGFEVLAGALIPTTPSGAAGGDLGSTYPNPTVLNLSHVTTGTLGVANGGTGAATLTAHGVLLGEATGPVVPTAAMGSGQILIGQGAAADPTPNTVTGDVLITSGGATTIQPGTVTTGKVAASAVTNALLANMADQTVKGNVSGGAAAPSDLSASQLKTLAGVNSLAKFTSSDQTITAATSFSVAHGLAGFPLSINYYLVCQVADHNYSPGDIISVAPQAAYTTNDGFTAKVDATNITVNISNGATPWRATDPLFLSTTYLTTSRWKMRIVATYF